MTDPLAYLFGLELFGIKFGLDNIRTLIGGLGHPERAFRSVHIAGTNGKGSVTAMVDAVLRAAGHRSARYTSPHLIDVTERFVIDGRPVAKDVLGAVVADLRDRIEALQATGALHVQPTFFEVTTAAALELFRRDAAEIAVVEVGLGGRLDATNVLTPMATAITSIAFDHQRYLGHTLGAIATEKAGIIKPGVPVVVGDLDGDADAAIAGVARERGAELVRAWDGVTAVRLPVRRTEMVRLQTDANRIRLQTPAHDYGEVTLALRGVHQIGNAVVAVRVLEILDRGGVGVSPEAIVDGLARVSWPGRLDHRSFPGGREALLDAAHNPAGAAALAAYLSESSEKPPPVFAAMRDKDVRGILEALLPSVGAVVVTRASNPRSADPDAIAAQAATMAPWLPALVRPRPNDALAAAWELSPRIVVAGSIFLLGDVIRETGGS